jgi:hypothetical protein
MAGCDSTAGKSTDIWHRKRRPNLSAQKEEQYALERGCSPPGPWVAKWPLGLDFLYHAFRRGLDQTVMEWFAEMGELSGTTHEQRLRLSLHVCAGAYGTDC